MDDDSLRNPRAKHLKFQIRMAGLRAKLIEEIKGAQVFKSGFSLGPITEVREITPIVNALLEAGLKAHKLGGEYDPVAMQQVAKKLAYEIREGLTTVSVALIHPNDVLE
jgi:hypothetical protein